jgi:hypothetical protein
MILLQATPVSRLWLSFPLGYSNTLMPQDAFDTVRKKVEAIFVELAGVRELQVRGSLPGGAVHSAVKSALSADIKGEVADEIAFHIVDWSYDAGFIVALHLYPERFTPEEIEAGIRMFLAHAPAHILAAARMMGYPTDHLFAKSDHDDVV